MSDPLQTLRAAGIEHKVQLYRRSESAAQVAAALGLAPRAMLKTIAFASMPEVVLACVPIDREVDVDALVAHLGEPRTMLLELAALERMTGFKAGGVTPIPSPGERRFRVVIDATAAKLAKVAVGAGSGVEVMLDPADLIAVTGAEVAAIAA